MNLSNDQKMSSLEINLTRWRGTDGDADFCHSIAARFAVFRVRFEGLGVFD